MNVGAARDEVAAGVPAFMRLKDYAAHQGVLPSAVSNWKKEGLVVFGTAPATARLVDVAATDANLAQRRDPMRGRPISGAAPLVASAPAPDTQARNELGQVRTELLKAQTAGKLMENARLAGELVPLIEAERRISEIARLARERCKAAFRSEAERLGVETDRRAIMALCDETIDQAFAQMADDVESGALLGDGDDGGDDMPLENDPDDEGES